MSLEHIRDPNDGELPLLLKPFLSILGSLQHGRISLELGDHEPVILTGPLPGPSARFHLKNPLAFYRNVLTRGDIGFAESYMEGHWDTPDLSGTLLFFAQNERYFSATGGKSLYRFLDRLWHRLLRRNSPKGSRKNIAYHYDLGNDFYRLWLDSTMTYSCGIFHGENERLETAQERKYRRVIDCLGLGEGDSVLEIGCGWGGFAAMAAKLGARVHGITLSTEQLAWARQRMMREDLTDKVELELRDYRTLTGTYDHIVSIEMLEAVGEAYWPVYFETVAKSLKPGGRAAIQVITIDEAYFDGYRNNVDFIQRYIFPGGMLPTPRILSEQARRVGLTVAAMDSFGHDYARTLHRWDERFCSVKTEVLRQGFDERFFRMWRYYLQYCAAGFQTERIDLKQFILTKPSAAED